MEKEEGEGWDDSALITALNQAISKYKKMHGEGLKASSTDTVVSDAHIIHSPQTVADLNISCEFGSTKQVDFGNFQVPDEHVPASSTIDHSQDYSTALDMDEYNLLYKQYYEIEDQRLKILQKMQHLTAHHYPYSAEPFVSGLHCATRSAAQQHQSTTQMPSATMLVTCCPSAPHSSVASCCPLTCPLTNAAAHTLCNASPATNYVGKLPPFENNDVVETALAAAGRAISTLKEETLESKEEMKLGNVSEQSGSLETDFSTVLNAWYSAGFYTGKYLTERSLAKKQHD